MYLGHVINHSLRPYGKVNGVAREPTQRLALSVNGLLISHILPLALENISSNVSGGGLWRCTGLGSLKG